MLPKKDVFWSCLLHELEQVIWPVVSYLWVGKVTGPFHRFPVILQMRSTTRKPNIIVQSFRGNVLLFIDWGWVQKWKAGRKSLTLLKTSSLKSPGSKPWEDLHAGGILRKCSQEKPGRDQEAGQERGERQSPSLSLTPRTALKGKLQLRVCLSWRQGSWTFTAPSHNLGAAPEDVNFRVLSAVCMSVFVCSLAHVHKHGCCRQFGAVPVANIEAKEPSQALARGRAQRHGKGIPGICRVWSPGQKGIH